MPPPLLPLKIAGHRPHGLQSWGLVATLHQVCNAGPPPHVLICLDVKDINAGVNNLRIAFCRELHCCVVVKGPTRLLPPPR